MKRRTFLQALAVAPALLLGGRAGVAPPEPRILKVTGLAGWDGPEDTEDVWIPFDPPIVSCSPVGDRDVALVDIPHKVTVSPRANRGVITVKRQ